MALYGRYRKQHYSEVDFWTMTRKAAHVIFDRLEDVDDLFALNGSWMLVVDKLNRINKSKFGSRLFGFAQTECAIDWLTAALEEGFVELDSLPNDQLMNKHFDDFKASLLQRIDTHCFSFVAYNPSHLGPHVQERSFLPAGWQFYGGFL